MERAPAESPNVVKLRSKYGDPRLKRLQEELWAIITSERYEELSAAETVGVLKFVEFNVINGSET